MSNPDFKYNSLTGHGITSQDFDECGLRWPSNHLDLMFPNIIFQSTHDQAKYVDQVCFEIVTKNDEVEIEILRDNLAKQTKRINATSIGNLAFIAIYCQDHRAKEMAFEALAYCIGQVAASIMPRQFIKPTAQA
ncbi:MAG: hypothetical protein K9H61_02390 [Bacteroidia bacterium]|nr:hypothetical protein [Bacteroidia bacterium]MCF8427175.1 hypothetical protein [Bacteroidia bacterium]MCF8445820.1 hypothetical protein [Bacteroidia bacterium]